MMQIFKGSILAGVFISLGAIAYLTVGGIVGSILFAFGLIGVTHYKLPLYTGTAGFIHKNEFGKLGIILFGNISGCLIMAVFCRFSCDLSASNIVSNRLTSSAEKLLILSVFCGFIMTTTVEFARQEKYLPMLFGIPLFISCGFIHSIADAFYYLLSPNSWNLLWIYPLIVIGNFVGCNIYRLCITQK